jgi:hypothetical protein
MKMPLSELRVSPDASARATVETRRAATGPRAAACARRAGTGRARATVDVGHVIVVVALIGTTGRVRVVSSAGGGTLGDDGAVCRARRVGRRVGKWAAEARRVPRREVRHRRDAVFIHPETIREDNWSPAVRGDATVPNRGNKVGARDRCAEGFVSPRSGRDERRARSRTWSPRNTVEVMTPRSGARRELIHSRARPDLKHPHVSSSPKSKSDQRRLRRRKRGAADENAPGASHLPGGAFLLRRFVVVPLFRGTFRRPAVPNP